MKFLNKMERKFGKYAIRNLTKYIILTYIVGYVLLLISSYSSFNVLSDLGADAAGFSGCIHDYHADLLLSAGFYSGTHLGCIPL